jgi:HK97 family phage major capsid protein
VNLNDARTAAIKSARVLLDGAKADDNRDLTDDEQSQVETIMAEVKSLDHQIKGRALVASVVSLGDGEDPETDDRPKDAPAKNLGEHFAKSVSPERFTMLKSISGYTVSSPEFKAATDPQITTGAGFVPVLTEYDTTIVRGNRPGPVVADLLGSGSISGNAISYFIEGAVEGAFATVAEVGQKPQMHYVDPTAAVDSLKKIAAWWDTSDEMVEDLAFMVSEINNRGLYLLSMFEEAQLINGLGTGSTIRGLLQRTGIQTEVQGVGPDTAQDALFRSMTKVQTATGFAADGIIINPVDYQKLRLSKDANGQYFGGGFFTGAYGNGGVVSQPPIWGLNTVVTTATAAGTAVVGAFKAAATVYRKGGVRVESTNSDLGKFTSNIVTTRVEERVALAVRIPSAIVKVTLL